MAGKTKVLGYEDKNYKQKENILSALQQAYEDIRFNRNSEHGWNRLITDLEGLKMTILPDEMIEITFMRYEMTTPQLLALMERDGSEFFREFEKELKKGFKDITKKTLKLKKKEEDVNYEKVSRMNAETSQFRGADHPPSYDLSGKYLIREKRLYSYSVS